MEPQCKAAKSSPAVDRRHAMSATATRGPNFAVLVGLGWLVIAADLLIRQWANTGLSMPDTDDALRLVEMRDYLHGQGWFDMHMSRLGPTGYESHWSRLIDAGLAGLFLLFHQFVDGALAERLMRAVWPLLWIVPATLSVIAITWRLAGREGAVVSLLLCVIALPAYQQFLPGRIDHHDVQITLALACMAATVWSDRSRGAAIAAGALSGLALAIGLENLMFVALCGAAFALRYVFDRGAAPALARYGWSLAAGGAAAFFVSVGPDHWGHAVCDTMAINWAVPVVAAGLLMGLAGRWIASERMAVRLTTAGAIAAVAGALFVAIEPRCLGGPYAMMDPQLRAIWFSHVSEMRPLASVLRDEPATGAAMIVFPATALAAALLLARDPATRRDFAFLLAASELAIGAALMLTIAKMCFYAIWLGMPLVGAFAPRLFARLRLQSLVARAFVAMLLTPSVLTVIVFEAVRAAAASPTEERDARVAGGCFKSANYAQLARLPPGLMATEVDLGSYVLALTPHSVLAGPYHRLRDGIMAAHDTFALPPAQARGVLRRLGVNYLVTCSKQVPPGLTTDERRTGLWGQLEAGNVPDWLVPVPAGPDEVFAVYRIRS
jgi:hypothetical protein